METGRCDICGINRSIGKHNRCSQIRKRIYQDNPHFRKAGFILPEAIGRAAVKEWRESELKKANSQS